MTMAFKAAPTITDAVAVGDKVDFDLTATGSAGEATAIHKQPRPAGFVGSIKRY